jgi:hypothetical protein
VNGGGNPSRAVGDPKPVKFRLFEGGTHRCSDIIDDGANREGCRDVASIVPTRTIADRIKIEVVANGDSILIQFTLLTLIALSFTVDNDFWNLLRRRKHAVCDYTHCPKICVECCPIDEERCYERVVKIAIIRKN